MSIYRLRKHGSPDVCKTRIHRQFRVSFCPLNFNLPYVTEDSRRPRQLQSGADFVGDISATYRHTVTWTHYKSSVT